MAKTIDKDMLNKIVELRDTKKYSFEKIAEQLHLHRQTVAEKYKMHSKEREDTDIKTTNSTCCQGCEQLTQELIRILEEFNTWVCNINVEENEGCEEVTFDLIHFLKLKMIDLLSLLEGQAFEEVITENKDDYNPFEDTLRTPENTLSPQAMKAKKCLLKVITQKNPKLLQKYV